MKRSFLVLLFAFIMSSAFSQESYKIGASVVLSEKFVDIGYYRPYMNIFIGNINMLRLGLWVDAYHLIEDYHDISIICGSIGYIHYIDLKEYLPYFGVNAFVEHFRDMKYEELDSFGGEIILGIERNIFKWLSVGVESALIYSYNMEGPIFVESYDIEISPLSLLVNVKI